VIDPTDECFELALKFYERSNLRPWDREAAIHRYHNLPSANKAVREIAYQIMDRLSGTAPAVIEPADTERPTPITDQLKRDLEDSPLNIEAACEHLLDSHAVLERQLAEAIKQRNAYRYKGQTKVTEMAHRIATVEQQRDRLVFLLGQARDYIDITTQRSMGDDFHSPLLKDINEALATLEP
jgi:hypothetical protein